MDENARAIAFANKYFALIDASASDLKNYLAEDVLLDWFGRTIRGKMNVAAFMESHKVISKHMFHDIALAGNIGYRRNKPFRKRFLEQLSDSNKGKDEADDVIASGGGDPHVDKMDNSDERDPSRVIEDDMTYDFNKGDLSNLFKLKITPTKMTEIEERINRIKLEEEMAPKIKLVKRECGQGDGPNLVKTSSLKFLQANGQIEFSRKTRKRALCSQDRSTPLHVSYTWRRSCKLQIAYSVMTENELIKDRRLSENGTTTDLCEEQNLFFRDFKVALKKAQSSLKISPTRVRERMTGNKSSNGDNDKTENKNFELNYHLIRLIIYEGNNRCRINLCKKFEKSY